MAGSTRGPVPKRKAELIRRNLPRGREVEELAADQFDDLPFEVESLVEPPPVNDDWHAIAKMQYEALLRDPARTWMGPADWALSYLMCESISREMSPQAIGVVDGGWDPDLEMNVAGHVAREIVPMKGAVITGILKWYSLIGVTEASRLGLKREVTFNQRPKPRAVDGGDVVDIRPSGWFAQGPQE